MRPKLCDGDGKWFADYVRLRFAADKPRDLTRARLSSRRVQRQYSTGEMSIFRELTEGLPRQAPGSAAATLRALGLVRGLPTSPRILDVGCGPGAQTIELARATNGWIVAVDIRQRFLDELTERAAAAGVLPQVTTINTSMFDMDFADASFDLIWSEGAIYIQGFAAGLDRMAPVPEAWRMARGIRTDLAGAESAARSRRILGAELSRHGLDRAQLPARRGSRIREHGRLRAPGAGLVEQLLRARRAPGRGAAGKVRRRSPTCSQLSTRPAASTISSAPITTPTATSST